jgi:hypothetical protein
MPSIQCRWRCGAVLKTNHSESQHYYKNCMLRKRLLRDPPRQGWQRELLALPRAEQDKICQETNNSRVDMWRALGQSTRGVMDIVAWELYDSLTPPVAVLNEADGETKGSEETAGSRERRARRALARAKRLERSKLLQLAERVVLLKSLKKNDQ